MKIRGLYVITDPTLIGPCLGAAVEAALQGGAAVVQYRQKDKLASTYLNDAQKLNELTKRYGATFIINDDVDLAREVDADGVHVGRSDTSIALARSILGRQKLVGVSCYNDMARARIAQQQGADYIALGSFFGSTIKPNAVRASIKLLGQAKLELTVPVVAIGGINVQNGQQLISAGADSLAVISAVFAQKDIKTAAQRLSNLFN